MPQNATFTTDPSLRTKNRHQRTTCRAPPAMKAAFNLRSLVDALIKGLPRKCPPGPESQVHWKQFFRNKVIWRRGGEGVWSIFSLSLRLSWLNLTFFPHFEWNLPRVCDTPHTLAAAILRCVGIARDGAANTAPCQGVARSLWSWRLHDQLTDFEPHVNVQHAWRNRSVGLASHPIQMCSYTIAS